MGEGPAIVDNTAFTGFAAFVLTMIDRLPFGERLPKHRAYIAPRGIP